MAICVTAVQQAPHSRYSPARVRSRLLAFIVCLLVLASASPTLAGSNDKEVTELVDGTLADDSFTSSPDSALEQLAIAKQACEGNTCSAKVRAKVYVAIGIVLAAGKKKTSAAKDAFLLALKEDPSATLPAKFATGDTQKAFEEAKKAGGGGDAGGSAGGSSGSGGAGGSSGSGGAGGASGSGGAGGSAEKPKSGGDAPLKPRKPYPGDVKPGRGWKTGEGFFFYQEAVASEGSRDWADCAATRRPRSPPRTASRRATSRRRARSAPASGSRRRRLQDRRRHAAAPRASARRRATKAKAAGARAEDPQDHHPQAGQGHGLVVKLNNVEIPSEKLGGEIWVNPGQRTITAKGKVDGVDGEFEQVVDIQEFETVDRRRQAPASRRAAQGRDRPQVHGREDAGRVRALRRLRRARARSTTASASSSPRTTTGSHGRRDARDPGEGREPDGRLGRQRLASSSTS
jgi:hypothetical protein